MLHACTRGVRAILALAVAAASASPAAAAEFITLEDACNGRQLMIRGPIAADDAEHFATALAMLVTGGALPSVQNAETLWTLKLDSTGGDLAAAMAIGRLVRAALLTTEVSYRFERRPDGVWDFAHDPSTLCVSGADRLAGCEPKIAVADCTGACLLIWLGGVDRRALEGRLGRHGLGSRPAEVVTYLRDMELDTPSIERLLNVPASTEDDGWLDWTAKLKLSGRAPALDTIIADCPPALTHDEAIDSVMTASPAERSALLDRAEAHWACRNAHLEHARLASIAALRQRVAGN